MSFFVLYIICCLITSIGGPMISYLTLRGTGATTVGDMVLVTMGWIVIGLMPVLNVFAALCILAAFIQSTKIWNKRL